MGETRQKRIGDGLGHTAPTRSNAPPVQLRDTDQAKEMLVVQRYVPFTGSGATTVMPVADQVQFVPLLPLPCDFKVDFGRIRITTSHASNAARMAFYSYADGMITKVINSEMSFPTDTGSVALTRPASFTLSRNTQYFWVSMSTGTTATFAGFSMSDASPRPVPYYTKTVGGLLTATLPNSFRLADLTANYTSNIFVGIMPVYYSASMISFL